MVTRGFFGRRPSEEEAKRLPPGQYLEKGFPVLSAGPTPIVKPADWRFTSRSARKPVKSWTWEEFKALPHDRSQARHPLRHQVDASSTPNGTASRSTTSSPPPASRRRRPTTCSPIPTTAIRPTCRSRIWSAARRWWRSAMTATRSPPTTAGRRGCWCRTSISGSRPNG